MILCGGDEAASVTVVTYIKFLLTISRVSPEVQPAVHSGIRASTAPSSSGIDLSKVLSVKVEVNGYRLPQKKRILLLCHLRKQRPVRSRSLRDGVIFLGLFVLTQNLPRSPFHHFLGDGVRRVHGLKVNRLLWIRASAAIRE